MDFMELERKILNKFLFIIFLLGGLSSCKQSKKYHDKTDEPAPKLLMKNTDKVLISRDSLLKSIVLFQKALNKSFKDPEDSPLTPSDKMIFEKLAFFPPNAQYIITARLIKTPEALPFGMLTTTGRISQERLYGQLFFELQGLPFQLEVYQSQDLLEKEGFEDYLFLPFSDLTNGNETYGGGRYIDLRLTDKDSILIDFNKAYNPYCAYNKKYSCPIVPAVNNLDVRITAGVLGYTH